MNSLNDGYPAGNGYRSPAVRRWSRVHAVTGVMVGVWLLLMAVTGIAINHQEGLGLVNVHISNAWLPGHYTDEFHPDSTALHVVVADLHSGRFFGPYGRYVSDLVGVLLIVSVVSGFRARRLRRQLTCSPAHEKMARTTHAIAGEAKPGNGRPRRARGGSMESSPEGTAREETSSGRLT